MRTSGPAASDWDKPGRSRSDTPGRSPAAACTSFAVHGSRHPGNTLSLSDHCCCSAAAVQVPEAFPCYFANYRPRLHESQAHPSCCPFHDDSCRSLSVSGLNYLYPHLSLHPCQPLSSRPCLFRGPCPLHLCHRHLFFPRRNPHRHHNPNLVRDHQQCHPSTHCSGPTNSSPKNLCPLFRPSRPTNRIPSHLCPCCLVSPSLRTLDPPVQPCSTLAPLLEDLQAAPSSVHGHLAGRRVGARLQLVAEKCWRAPQDCEHRRTPPPTERHPWPAWYQLSPPQSWPPAEVSQQAEAHLTQFQVPAKPPYWNLCCPCLISSTHCTAPGT
mmetsp:Transcript_49335/g.107679  ORF Transcript_49335/g.107679 Transcript_49335/m.107679 type:complete len:325 (-) Transcript_49335:182-1156(-)